MAKIAIMGFGTVGSGVLEVCRRNAASIARRAGEPVEVKYILHLSCYDVLLGDEPLVTDVTEQPAQPAEPGILLCFSQAGEGVWDIAKRYRVSCDSLKRMNPDLQDGVAGQQVILWHRQG